ncbi:hypothetical protein WDZ92_49105, partial [Nostoc sp. NIES-2111]
GWVTPRAAARAAPSAVVIATLHIAVFLAIGIARHGPSVEALRNIVSGILSGDGREVTVYLLPVSAAVAAVLGILAGRGWALRLCRIPGLQGVGRISYGGYVFHLPVLLALRAFLFPGALGAGSRILLFIVAMLITLLLAAASHRWFESRFLHGRHRRAPSAPRRTAVA